MIRFWLHMLTWPFLLGLTGLFGGGSQKTDRSHQLEGWGGLRDIMYGGKSRGFGSFDEGASNLTSAGDYFKALMSGDQTKMAQVLAPQISTIRGQESQRINSMGQFGNRSGGTNAAMQAETEGATKSIQELFDMLGPEAASKVAAIGGQQEAGGANLLGLSEHAAGTLSSQAGWTRENDIARQQQGANDAVKALLGLFLA